MKRLICTIFLVVFTLSLTFAQSKNMKTAAHKTEATSKIIVYGSDTCHFCIDTKSYLKKNNIAFLYYDIDQDKAKELEMVTKLRRKNIPLNNLSLPVVDIKGSILINKGDFDTFLEQLIVK